MSYGTPGIPSSPPFIVTGTPSDGDVPTSDGAGGIAWEAGGGGGGGSGLAVVGTPYPGAKPRYNAEASPAEYTVDRWITDRIFDAADYGASGDSRQAVTSGSTAAGTSVTLASGQGAMFREGNHLVIPFAGAASTFAAVTPETPTLFTGGTAGATTVNISYSAMDGNGGYSPPSVAGAITTANATLSDSNYLTYWHRTTRLAGESVSFTAAASYVVVDWAGLEYTVMVVQVSSTGTLPAGLSASTYYWLRSQKTVPDPQRWSIHATHRDAVANVNPIAVDAGSGTHTITRYEEADGYVYFGRGTSNRFAIRRKSGAPNAFFVTFQAGGYTNAVAADIGRSVVYGGSARGTLRWYDNTARTWVVEMGNDAQSNYFPAASAVTITGGTGVGTTTGNAEEVHVLVDAGDTSAAYDHRTFAYRASTVYEEGDLVLSPFSASGVWYEVDATYDDRTSHSSAPTFDATLNNFTVDGGAALRFRRLNQIIPVAEPAGTLPQTYFGEVTAVATDTLTITPSTTSTVASGSMVAHNDFPATKTAFDALLSNGGGELFISGDHDWFTDAIGGNSWTARPGGAINWSLFGLAPSGTSLNRFRLRFGNGTTVRHRPLDVPALIYATSDQEGGCSLFNFVTAFRPEIDFAGGRLLCIPACEPGAEHDSSINTLLVASSTQGGSVNDVSQAPKMRDGTIAGFSGLGAFTNQVSAGSGLLCQDVHVRFSMGGGHDSGYSASSAGTFIRGSFEGVRRWGSTTCYTATSTLDPFHAHGVYFKNVRGDGLRLRSLQKFRNWRHW